MSRALALVGDPLRATRRGAIAWAASLVALVLVTVAFWPAFEESTQLIDFFEQLPPGVIEAFGMEGFSTPAGYLRGNLYDILVPLLFGAAAVAFANGLTAGEEDAGRLELVFAQPVSRVAAFAGRALAMVTWSVVLAAVTAVTQVAGNAAFGLEIGLGRLLETIVLCWLLGLLHGALGIAIAGLVPRPALVLGIPLVVLVAGFVVAALFPLSDDLRGWAVLSPWDWALGSDPLVEPSEPWRYLALAAPSVVLVLAGLAAFARRDIRSA